MQPQPQRAVQCAAFVSVCNRYPRFLSCLAAKDVIKCFVSKKYRCCKMHDWCYTTTTCHGLEWDLPYFVPFKWKCNGGAPYCSKIQFIYRMIDINTTNFWPNSSDQGKGG